ncbi:hypothetical protein [Photobacterium chitinilyticum]|uniref:DUF4393 domain-containing protein n=1 Tax=Photobacterium chitinilyticum TaxID=2485123 RepID=A0A3S3UFK6_9GAMM|nr:hypothetical protein [Photobacterium chitinilyticum]RWX52722.1 hypothetical protein EDI28_25820 [Photobacterium chitinilyticum]
MDNDNKIDSLAESTEEKVYRMFKAIWPVGAGVAAIYNPVVSAALTVGSVAFESLYDDPRMEKLCRHVSKLASNKPEYSVLSMKDFTTNQEFISCLNRAQEVIKKNHQDEKIEMLAHALVNSINSNVPFSKKAIFLSLIDELTVEHIQVLNLVSDELLWVPKSWPDYNVNVELSRELCQQLGFENNELIYIHSIVNDLISKRLILNTELKVNHNQSIASKNEYGMVLTKLTSEQLDTEFTNYCTNLSKLGLEFVSFVSEKEI